MGVSKTVMSAWSILACKVLAQCCWLTLLSLVGSTSILHYHQQQHQHHLIGTSVRLEPNNDDYSDPSNTLRSSHTARTANQPTLLLTGRPGGNGFATLGQVIVDTNCATQLRLPFGVDGADLLGIVEGDILRVAPLNEGESQAQDEVAARKTGTSSTERVLSAQKQVFEAAQLHQIVTVQHVNGNQRSFSVRACVRACVQSVLVPNVLVPPWHHDTCRVTYM